MKYKTENYFIDSKIDTISRSFNEKRKTTENTSNQVIDLSKNVENLVPNKKEKCSFSC